MSQHDARIAIPAQAQPIKNIDRQFIITGVQQAFTPLLALTNNCYVKKWVENRHLCACKHQPVQPIHPAATHLDRLSALTMTAQND